MCIFTFCNPILYARIEPSTVCWCKTLSKTTAQFLQQKILFHSLAGRMSKEKQNVSSWWFKAQILTCIVPFSSPFIACSNRMCQWSNKKYYFKYNQISQQGAITETNLRLLIQKLSTSSSQRAFTGRFLVENFLKANVHFCISHFYVLTYKQYS